MPSAWSLYISDGTIGQGGWHLSSIDKLSLRDSPGIDLRGFGHPIASADGSTLAWIDNDHLQDGKAHVIDPTTGRDRAAFGGLAMHGLASLTPDGSGVLVLNQAGWGWELVRAGNGRVVADMNWKDPCCGPYLFWLSPDGRYMYRVLTALSGSPQPAGPTTPVLVRYDLQAGREASRLRLTGVVAGIWPREGSASAHMSLQLIPGVALSPDGRTLAIVHADSERLSLVDLERWQMASTRPLTRASSFWDRLSLRAVTDVQAKEVEGPEWEAFFLPDGQTLVAWGRSMSGGSPATVRGLGIRTIDVRSAGIRMEVPGGDDQLTQVVPAPDGSAIYAITEADQPTAPADDRLVVLRRLDPRTLAVTAARTFRGRRTLIALASA